MGLTPHEERQIQQIEDSLAVSDPEFAAYMSRLCRPRRRYLVGGLCCLIIAVSLFISGSTNSRLTIVGTCLATLLAGWCIGRAGRFHPARAMRLARVTAIRAGRGVARLFR